MKKNTMKVITMVMVTILSLGSFIGCTGGQAGESGRINLITREEGSGTRSAFVELFEVQIEDSSGKKIDGISNSAVQTNSTSVMLTTVSGDVNAIGYISLGSLNNTVKAIQIDGVDATIDNVKNGTYKISRPFFIATLSSVNQQTQDFINFIMSKEGQKVISDFGCLAVNENAPAYVSNGSSGKVVVGGSSSVTPVMEKLKEAYVKVNTKVSIEINATDSSSGMTSTISGVCDIGMSSRDLKDTELSAGLKPTKIAIDGLAVIVNKNCSINNLTKEQVRNIFLGTTKEWSDI
ncbi:MAG: substrate-binding domain-containing protein [Coriobacteriia bacterium]|nr:substrate-binding domain-containing protein [Coriobacteriia bacterium]